MWGKFTVTVDYLYCFAGNYFMLCLQVPLWLLPIGKIGKDFNKFALTCWQHHGCFFLQLPGVYYEDFRSWWSNVIVRSLTHILTMGQHCKSPEQGYCKVFLLYSLGLLSISSFIHIWLHFHVLVEIPGNTKAIIFSR